MSLFLGMLAVTASCVPTDKPKQTNIQVATAFFAAFNANDTVALGAMIKPGTRMIMGPGDSLELAELLGMMPAGATLEPLEMKAGTDGTVVVKTRSNDGLEGTGTLKFEGGCIVELVSQT
jgi:hypothetical protein